MPLFLVSLVALLPLPVRAAMPLLLISLVALLPLPVRAAYVAVGTTERCFRENLPGARDVLSLSYELQFGGRPHAPPTPANPTPTTPPSPNGAAGDVVPPAGKNAPNLGDHSSQTENFVACTIDVRWQGVKLREHTIDQRDLYGLELKRIAEHRSSAGTSGAAGEDATIKEGSATTSSSSEAAASGNKGEAPSTTAVDHKESAGSSTAGGTSTSSAGVEKIAPAVPVFSWQPIYHTKGSMSITAENEGEHDVCLECRRSDGRVRFAGGEYLSPTKWSLHTFVLGRSQQEHERHQQHSAAASQATKNVPAKAVGRGAPTGSSTSAGSTATAVSAKVSVAEAEVHPDTLKNAASSETLKLRKRELGAVLRMSDVLEQQIWAMKGEDDQFSSML